MNQNLKEINMKKIISLIAAIGLTTSMFMQMIIQVVV
jgi:hypothetical protein